MALDASMLQRADQIAYHFFTKFVLLVDNARNVASEPREDGRIDKWFNLETPDSEAFKEQLRIYKAISQLSSPPTLEVLVLLNVPDLTDKQVLVHHPPNSPRTQVEPTPRHILLERWTLTFSANALGSSGSSGSSASSFGEVTLSSVYKHAMSVFRSLFTLLRLLPAWRLCKRRRPGVASRNGSLNVDLCVRVKGPEVLEEAHVLGFDEHLSPSSPSLPTGTCTFDPVTHPMGLFSLGVTYLSSPHFKVDTVEALLSSRFLSQDAGSEFTPTLARNAQRDSISGSPASLPLRTSLPRSPPRNVPAGATQLPGTGTGTGAGLDLNLGTAAISSIAERFVLPANTNQGASGSRSSLQSASPRSRNMPLPGPMQVQRSTSAQQGVVGSGSAGSTDSSSRLSRDDGREGVSSASRGRRESLGTGRGSMDLPSVQGALLIRRQSANVQPFKSSALSSGSPSLYSNSPSFRHASPLSGPTLPSNPSRPSILPPSPTNSRVPALRSGVSDGGTGQFGPSSSSSSRYGGTGGITTIRAESSPVLPLRPSPPGVPSAPASLGDRKPPISPIRASAELPLDGIRSGTEPLPAPARRKRYSSSFGHRYMATGSDSSPGSAEKGKEKETDRPGSASYLSSITDDDDISAFVQEIDARKPIGGGFSGHCDRDRSSSMPRERRSLSTHSNMQPREAPTQPLRHLRTVSEGPRFSSVREAREAAFTVPIGQAQNPGTGTGTRAGAIGADEAAGILINQVTIDEKLKELNDRFQTSMGLVERRPSPTDGNGSVSGSGSGESHSRTSNLFAPSPSFTRASARSPLSRVPSSPLHTPLLTAGGSPVSRLAQLESIARRSSGGPPMMTMASNAPSLSSETYATIWDNRRRTDSAGSAGSGLSELERVRLFYRQSLSARESAVSVGGASAGSEEVVGKLEMDR